MYPQCYLYTHHWACIIVRWRKRFQYRKLSIINTKITSDLEIKVVTLLKKYLSLEPVSLYLQQHHKINISYECIYRYIYSNKEREIEFKLYLRQEKRRYRKRYESTARSSLIPNRRPIPERTRIIEDKKRIRDWIGSVTRSVERIEKAP